MIPVYIAKLDLITWKSNIGAQKIDSLLLKTYNRASAKFSLQESLERV